jgi:hypothetical protein
MSPGGLCFISDIRFPIKKYMIFQLSFNFLGKDINVYGHLIWTDTLDENINVYGLEFTFSEAERVKLTKLLNQYQIIVQNSIGQPEGSFLRESYMNYFHLDEGKVML